MKNKGFTLLEIMSVVIIIGILLLIGIPAITRNIITARKSVYGQHEKTLETVAKSYMNECMSEEGGACSLPEKGRTVKMLLSDFISMGMIRDGLENPETSPKYCDVTKSFVVIKNEATKSNSYDLTYEVCLSCSGYESGYCKTYTSTPVCTTCAAPSCGGIELENTIWTNKNVTVGVRCIGNGVNCLRDVFYEKVTTSGQIVNVTIRDEAGKTRACPVNAYVDRVSPVVGIEITNATDSSESLDGWSRGITKVEMTSLSDALSGVNTWGMGTSAKANFNKLKAYDAKDGISAVYGYGKDNAENIGGADAAIEIKRDNQAPTISGVYLGYQIYPNRGDLSSLAVNKISVNNRLAEYGAIRGVKLFFSSNPSGSEIIVYENNNEQNRLVLGSGYLEASIPLEEKSYSDMQFTFSNGQEARLTRVEVIVSKQAGFYSNQDLNVYVEAFDLLSTVRDYSFDNGATWQVGAARKYTVNTNNVAVVVRDRAGNKTSFGAFNISNIDKTAPTCSLKQSGTIGVENWYKSNVLVSYDATGDNLSGVRDHAFHVSGEGTTKTRTQTTDTSGQLYTGYVLDKAGNIGSCATTVKKDTVAPTCVVSLAGSVGENAWYVGNVTVTRISDYDERSGLLKKGLANTSPALYNSTDLIIHTGDTTGVTYYGYVQDKAGNEGVCNKTFKKDSTKPTCTITANKTADGANGWYISDVILTLNRNDATSGVQDYGLARTTGAYNKLSSVTDSTESANTVWRGMIKDNAGNENVCSHTVKIDSTKPTCTITANKTADGANGWYISDVILTLNRNDTLSGVQDYGLARTTGAYNKSSSVTDSTESANTVWRGMIKDNAGNENVCSHTVKIDSTKPTCTITANKTADGANGWYISDVILTLNRNDATSGVQDYGLARTTGAYNKLSSVTDSTESANTVWRGMIKDNAGNENVCSHTVKIDKTNPTCSVNFNGTTGNNGWYRSNVTVATTGTDATSGVSRRGVSTTNPATFASNTGTQANTAGTTWYGIVEDNAGRTTNCSASVKVDTSSPSCSLTKTLINSTAGVNATLTASDAGPSGLSSATPQYKTGVMSNQNYTVIDNAGNSYTCTLPVDYYTEYNWRNVYQSCVWIDTCDGYVWGYVWGYSYKCSDVAWCFSGYKLPSITVRVGAIYSTEFDARLSCVGAYSIACRCPAPEKTMYTDACPGVYSSCSKWGGYYYCSTTYGNWTGYQRTSTCVPSSTIECYTRRVYF